MEDVLQIHGLNITAKKKKKEVLLVHDLTMRIGKRHITALVGESGSGKSMTALAISQLLPPHITMEGHIMLADTDISTLTRKELNRIRARDMSIIFQEPFRALNPLIRVGKQVEEVLTIHTKVSRAERKMQVLALFKEMGLSNPLAVYHAYPHQLSGGINQRVMIAIASILKPKLLIADEPTTALDVTVQKQILMLMKHLRDKNGTSILLITHDLALASEICDYVYVMYAGHIVETASVHELFTQPCHPYTKALLKAIPRAEIKMTRLYSIEGTPPNPSDPVTGCRFYPRCIESIERCAAASIPLYQQPENRSVRCIRYEKEC